MIEYSPANWAWISPINDGQICVAKLHGTHPVLSPAANTGSWYLSLGHLRASWQDVGYPHGLTLSRGLPSGDKWPRTDFMYLGDDKVPVNSDSGDTMIQLPSSNESKRSNETLLKSLLCSAPNFLKSFSISSKTSTSLCGEQKTSETNCWKGLTQRQYTAAWRAKETSENLFLPCLKQLHHEFTI